MENEERKEIICPACFQKYTKAEVEKALACPQCGNTVQPYKISDEVNVEKINWGYLRQMAVYAARYAAMLPANQCCNDHVRVIQVAIAILEDYRPKDAHPLVNRAEYDHMNQNRKLAVKPNRQGNIPSPYFPKPPRDDVI